jgi:hypothetical protein
MPMQVTVSTPADCITHLQRIPADWTNLFKSGQTRAINGHLVAAPGMHERITKRARRAGEFAALDECPQRIEVLRLVALGVSSTKPRLTWRNGPVTCSFCLINWEEFGRSSSV